MEKRFDTALKLAEKTGSFLKESRNKIEVFRNFAYDIKLKQDTDSEAIILDEIEKQFPEDGYISEERGSKESRSGFLWVIDPLDGTVNYSRGIPQCCVSIACRNGQKAFGIVNDFFRGEMFAGRSGKGASLNGKEIRVSSVDKLEDAIMCFGLMKEKEEIQSGFSILSGIALNVRKIRTFGSAALDLCYIAAGRTDLFWEVGLNPWDTEAGKIIIEEAGGRYMEYNVHGKKLNYADNGLLKAEDLCKNLLSK